MKKQLSLEIICGVAVAGILFSGYLSYGEIVAKACPVGGACTSVLGAPSCVYGFVMYLAVFGVSLAGLRSRK